MASPDIWMRTITPAESAQACNAADIIPHSTNAIEGLLDVHLGHSGRLTREREREALLFGLIEPDPSGPHNGPRVSYEGARTLQAFRQHLAERCSSRRLSVAIAEPTTYTCVTVYFSGPFGWTGHHAKVAEVREGTWAQFDDAIGVTWWKPRCRKADSTVRSGRDVVIVQGRGPEKPVDPFNPPQVEGQVIAQRTKMASCDPGWTTLFDAWLAQSGLTVLADYRRPKAA